jgi:hypothetical protein
MNYQPVFRDDLCRRWHALYQGWLSAAEQQRKENECKRTGRNTAATESASLPK